MQSENHKNSINAFETHLLRRNWFFRVGNSQIYVVRTKQWCYL